MNRSLHLLRPPGFEKVMTYREAANLARPLVLLNGTFDLLHPSHVKRLAVAAGYRFQAIGREKMRVGSLIVSLDTDRRVERLKGRPPVLSLMDRTAIVAPYPYVDAVVWHSDDLPISLVIACLGPDVWLAREDLPAEELAAADRYQVRVVTVPRQGPHSSSRLRDRLLGQLIQGIRVDLEYFKSGAYLIESYVSWRLHK